MNCPYNDISLNDFEEGGTNLNSEEENLILEDEDILDSV